MMVRTSIMHMPGYTHGTDACLISIIFQFRGEKCEKKWCLVAKLSAFLTVLPHARMKDRLNKVLCGEKEGGIGGVLLEGELFCLCMFYLYR